MAITVTQILLDKIDGREARISFSPVRRPISWHRENHERELILKCAKEVTAQLGIKNLLGNIETEFEKILPIVFKVLQDEGPKF
jgi:hypothetical protein